MGSVWLTRREIHFVQVGPISGLTRARLPQAPGWSQALPGPTWASFFTLEAPRCLRYSCFFPAAASLRLDWSLNLSLKTSPATTGRKALPGGKG